MELEDGRRRAESRPQDGESTAEERHRDGPRPAGLGPAGARSRRRAGSLQAPAGVGDSPGGSPQTQAGPRGLQPGDTCARFGSPELSWQKSAARPRPSRGGDLPRRGRGPQMNKARRVLRPRHSIGDLKKTHLPSRKPPRAVWQPRVSLGRRLLCSGVRTARVPKRSAGLSLPGTPVSRLPQESRPTIVIFSVRKHVAFHQNPSCYS
ncbi:uncharacterized protein LOC132023991 [Mustela nigripes]|uniref:uncharacterized protein LOC132023991 n=1 Tax=Mustela nigripes TaxID=77151 RepID=UPI0028156ED3|nr:uncharacterized protein LOC132023991 [Mustela nigripes]